jgi:hypothetical protein
MTVNLGTKVLDAERLITEDQSAVTGAAPEQPGGHGRTYRTLGDGRRFEKENQGTHSMKTQRATQFRVLGWLAVVALLAVAILGPTAGSALAGTPTSGATSDLKGIASSYTNVLIDGAAGTSNDTVLLCSDNTATQFVSHISFSLSQTAPAGSYFRVYLTPNGGAQLTPAGVDITANQGTIDTSGLTAGDYSLPITLNVTTSFDITSGGVLLVIADDVSGAKFNSKSNSLNCTEAAPTPTPTVAPTPTPTVAPTPTPTGGVEASTSTAPTATPTGGVEGATGTPATTLPPTDTVGNSSPTSGGWRILLVGLAGLLAVVLLLSPSRRRNRR